jgi:hypothetical protein
MFARTRRSVSVFYNLNLVRENKVRFVSCSGPPSVSFTRLNCDEGLCCEISTFVTATDIRATVHSEIDIYIGSACNWPNFLALQLIVSGKM